MSAEDNKRLVARMYEEGWGKGALEVFDQSWASPHVLHWNEQKPTDQQRTADELKAIARSYRSAFPDLTVKLNQMVAEGEKVAVQVTFEGTHCGQYEGFGPTKRKSRFTDMQIFTFAGGKIAETTLGSGGLRYFFAILDGSAFEQ